MKNKRILYILLLLFAKISFNAAIENATNFASSSTSLEDIVDSTEEEENDDLFDVSYHNATTTTTPEFDYYVCGKNDNDYNYDNDRKSTVPDCSCKENEIICEYKKVLSDHFDSDYDDYEDKYIHVEFKSCNIKILNNSFIPENVTFQSNTIPIIMKGKILNGNEKTVVSLRLPENEIAEIENGTFDKFTSLNVLSLGHNKLTNISDAVFTKQLGETLTELHLSYNHFSSILSINFSNLKNLKILVLNNNDFNLDKNTTNVFPEALSTLTVLNLGKCNITSLNENFFAFLTSLQKLILYGNPLSTFPHSINALLNLQYLDLDNTKIVNLNNTANLKVNFKLEKLFLTQSNLQTIGDCAFCAFPNLKILYLWKNQHLSYIHENAFGYAFNGTSPSLESFSIEFCKLSTIPEKLLNWSNLKEIGIEGNPFYCNCSLVWLINDLTSNTMNFKSIAPLTKFRHNGMRCSAPHHLRDVSFIHITGKLCNMEMQKYQSPPLTTTTTTKEENDKNLLSLNYLIITFAVIASFALGFASFPFCRYLVRLKKQKTQFFYKEENNDKIMEDFDDGSTNISNV